MSAPRWRRWINDHDLDWAPDGDTEAAKPTLTIDGDDPIIGRIYGPGGTVIKVVRPPVPDRAPFGFSA